MTDAEPLLADFMARRLVGKAEQLAAGQAFAERHRKMLGIVRDAVDAMDQAGCTPPHIVLVLMSFARAIRKQRVE